MKRLILLAACLITGVAVFGQQDTLPRNPIYDAGLSGDRRFGISGSSEGGEAVFSLLGYEITLAGQSSPDKFKRVRFSVGFTHGEVGFATLTGTQYSGYDSESTGFMDVNTWKSYHVSLRLLNARVVLNKSRTLYFNAGIGFSVDNFSFSNNLILDYKDDRIIPVPLVDGLHNGSLSLLAINIPVQLDVVLARKWMLSGYVSLDIIDVGSRFPKRRTSIESPVSMSVGATLTYYGIGLYVRYGALSMFRAGSGVTTHPLSFGLAVAF